MDVSGQNSGSSSGLRLPVTSFKFFFNFFLLIKPLIDIESIHGKSANLSLIHSFSYVLQADCKNMAGINFSSLDVHKVIFYSLFTDLQ